PPPSSPPIPFHPILTHPPNSPLFPSTTLFRSRSTGRSYQEGAAPPVRPAAPDWKERLGVALRQARRAVQLARAGHGPLGVHHADGQGRDGPNRSIRENSQKPQVVRAYEPQATRLKSQGVCLRLKALGWRLSQVVRPEPTLPARGRAVRASGAGWPLRLPAHRA